jgi:hypothetical protein
MAKGIIQRDVIMNEGETRPQKNDPTKNSCPILIEIDGKLYTMYANEGGPLWSVRVGDTVDNIEIVEEPKTATGRGFAKLQRQNNSGGGFKPYQRREWQTPTQEKAKEAADFTANLFKAIKGRLPELSDEAVAMLVGKLTEKLC